MRGPAERAQDSAQGSPAPSGLTFDAVYEAQLEFVWAAVHRLGVSPADTDDVVQEIFLVVHRRLAEFEARSGLRTWLFKILIHVVRHHWRSHRRKPGNWALDDAATLDLLPSDHERGPAALVEKSQSLRILDGLLGQLDQEKREVFVLAELEELTAAQIADVLDINVNTASSRLRAARQRFAEAVQRFEARAARRQP